MNCNPFRFGSVDCPSNRDWTLRTISLPLMRYHQSSTMKKADPPRYLHNLRRSIVFETAFDLDFSVSFNRMRELIPIIVLRSRILFLDLGVRESTISTRSGLPSGVDESELGTIIYINRSSKLILKLLMSFVRGYCDLPTFVVIASTSLVRLSTWLFPLRCEFMSWKVTRTYFTFVKSTSLAKSILTPRHSNTTSPILLSILYMFALQR